MPPRRDAGGRKKRNPSMGLSGYVKNKKEQSLRKKDESFGGKEIQKSGGLKVTREKMHANKKGKGVRGGYLNGDQTLGRKKALTRGGKVPSTWLERPRGTERGL